MFDPLPLPWEPSPDAEAVLPAGSSHRAALSVKWLQRHIIKEQIKAFITCPSQQNSKCCNKNWSVRWLRCNKRMHSKQSVPTIMSSVVEDPAVQLFLLTLHCCHWVRLHLMKRRETGRAQTERCCDGWVTDFHPEQNRTEQTTQRIPSCSSSNRCTLDVALVGFGTEGRGQVHMEHFDRVALALEIEEVETTEGKKGRQQYFFKNQKKA